MAEFTDNKTFDRRGFLKGSALFAAAALGVAASLSPVFAQEPATQSKPEDGKKDDKKGDASDKDGKGGSDANQAKQPAGQQATQKDPNKLYDKNGVEYRVCERCGGNVYRDGNTWTCEQCGLSYTE